MDRTASDEYVGVQTFMEIKDEQLVEVQLEENNLLELLLSPSNLNAAYRQVVR
ncbi:group II intron reverse transcriptase/maturase, partial [Bacteroides thetaiotaomicron]